MTKESITTDVVISEYKKQISFIQEQAELMSITSQMDLDKAGQFLTVVMKVEKTLADRKAEITKPLMAGLASARELFKPLEQDHAEAKKTIKSKMLEYTIAEQERVALEQERVEKRVEKGTMRVDTAISKLSNLTGPDTHLTTRRKFRITDEALVPREYLCPDLDKIKEAVLKQGLTITGVEVYEEKSIVGSTR
jgi:hypothetical protein